MITGPGLLFVVSGPSGAGKDTLVDALREQMPRLRYSVSATTRAPRPGEREGEHYFFLSKEAFEARQAQAGFLEWREYNGNCYGTPRDFVERTLAAGYDLIMKPEVNGALAVKTAYPDAVLIFLVPDKFSQLRERLLARRTETNEEIARRLEIAHQEMKFIRNFDYLRDQRTRAARSRPPPTSPPSCRRNDSESIASPTTRSRASNTPNRKDNTVSKTIFGDLDALLKHTDSKFSLVNIVTKRARQLNNWIRVQQLPRVGSSRVLRKRAAGR